MHIYIFDIDGTLTDPNPELVQQAGYPTHAYWDLVTHHFVRSSEALQTRIDSWRTTVAETTGDEFINSSAAMMQQALEMMTPPITEAEIISYAEAITTDFINAGVVRREAIAYLKMKAEEGYICILSTGAYESGAKGFLNALVTQGLLSEEAKANIIVSGAIVNWDSLELTHANVHNNKVVGLNAHLQTKYGFDASERDCTVFADDPEGNDYGILMLADSENRYVITDELQDSPEELPYQRTTWEDIVAAERPSSGSRP